jgi:hypothetical protein
MSQAETPNNSWRSLYIIGGIAPLVTLTFYVSEFIFIPRDGYPATIEGWFSLIHSSKYAGLLYLNALDIISISLLGVMFMAIYIALRQANKSLTAVATYFALLGVTVFVVPRVAALSLLPLSDRYAAATTDAQRAAILGAGEALGALVGPTPLTAGFLLMAVGVFILSIVMLRAGLFNKATAYLGLAASVLTMVDHVTVISAPALAIPLMIVSGLFWIPWWVVVGLGLLRLARLEEM